METYTISDYEWARDFEIEAENESDAAYYDGIIDKLNKILPHSCGSKEFYLAPIVNIRCAKCNQPL